MQRQEPGVTELGLANSGLLSLVDELLLNIIDHIDSQAALCNLAATCARFQGLVEPYVWRNLLVLRGAHARMIATALDSREARVDYIQELAVRYKDEVRDGIEELNHFLGLMTKLRHLTIESPCPNNLEWRASVYFDGWSRIDFTNLLASSVYPREGIPLALPMLQSLNLHGHGSGDQKFRLGRAVAMFLHPTLRKITLSCMQLESDLKSSDITDQQRKSTALQSLTFIECNVHVPFLSVILSLPKALKELEIGERLYAFSECEPSMVPAHRTSSKEFLTALQQQAGSLQRLNHIGGNIAFQTPRETDPDGAAKLRSLVNLEHLELGFESHLYYYLRQNGFPPKLKSLKMLDTAISLNSGNDLRTISDVAYRSITTLVTEHLPNTLQPNFTLQLKFADHYYFRLFVMPDPTEQDRFLSTLFLNRASTYKIVNILKSFSAHFTIAREAFKNGRSCIPPFMHGEELPIEELMYDSSQPWHFCGIDYQLMDDEQLRGRLRAQKELYLCVRCRRRGLGLEDCLNLGDGSACLACRRAHLPCMFIRNSMGGLVSAEGLDHNAL